MPRSIHRALLSRFARNRSGSVTVEALFWFSMISGIIVLIVGTSSALYTYSNVMRSLQDGNRLLSVGYFEDPDQVATYLHDELVVMFPGVSAQALLDGDILVTQVSIPWTDMHLFGFMRGWSTTSVEFNAAHRVEWLG
ncbi:hypothetical protein HKCCE3408_08705 [Rhodobacterales bacterium HKCCE3408]|nr:hypothetical protein [Rhodobacterales bacterium HKCCE3408]